jgi:hypothetical protein
MNGRYDLMLTWIWLVQRAEIDSSHGMRFRSDANFPEINVKEHKLDLSVISVPTSCRPFAA